MKKLIILIVLLSTTFSIYARDPQRGYRGFVDVDANVTSYKYDNYERWTEWMIGVSTSHGYQFNPHLFVGGGLMIDRCTDYDKWMVPVFAQIRTDQHWGKFTPFGDFRIGYNCTDGGGIYLSPTIGYRFNFGRKLNLNVGLGMTLRGYAVERYDISFWDENFEMTYLGKSHESKANFTIRVGIDF